MANEDVLERWEMTSHISESDAADRVMVDSLRRGGDALAAALREARELNDSRLDDVSTLLGAFNDGLFVRSTHGDSDPRWAIKLFAPLAAMARLQRSVDAAMKPPGGEGSGHE